MDTDVEPYTLIHLFLKSHIYRMELMYCGGVIRSVLNELVICPLVGPLCSYVGFGSLMSSKERTIGLSVKSTCIQGMNDQTARQVHVRPAHTSPNRTGCHMTPEPLLGRVWTHCIYIEQFRTYYILIDVHKKFI